MDLELVGPGRVDGERHRDALLLPLDSQPPLVRELVRRQLSPVQGTLVLSREERSASIYFPDI